MYDFGLEESEMKNNEIIQQKIIEMDKNFDLVLIQERCQFRSNDFVYKITKFILTYSKLSNDFCIPQSYDKNISQQFFYNLCKFTNQDNKFKR